MRRTFATLTALLIAVVAGARLARPDGPLALRHDPAGRARVEEYGRRLAEAIALGDGGERRRVLAEIVDPTTIAGDGMNRMLTLLDRLHERLGAPQFHHAEVVEVEQGGRVRRSLHVYVKSAVDGGWKDVQLFLETAPPYRIRQLAFLAEVAEPVYLPNGGITEPGTIAWLNGYVDRLVSDADLSGGLLIARADDVLVERYFGHADSARRRPIDARTRFDLASGGKMFTALALAQLVEEGRLSFGDTLARRAPVAAGVPAADSITVSELLAHTAGVGEFWTDDFRRRWDSIRTLSDFLPLIAAAGRASAPGARASYSNSHYILAGLVLEAVTGASYASAVEERLWGRLGMTSTGLFEFRTDDSLLAQRFARGPRGWVPAARSSRGSSAGGAQSTLRDMLRFARALAAGRIVPPARLAEMMVDRTSALAGSDGAYGYGFLLERTPGGVRSYGHGGIASGSNFELRVFPDLDITLVAFSNQDNGAYDDLRRNAIRLVTGER